MNNLIFNLLIAVLIGIGATLTFDLWSLFLKLAFKITPSNICLVGRWVRYMPEGVFRHASIGSAPRKNAECITGWLTHYLIGIVFACMFLSVTGNDWLRQPKLIPAIAFGLITVLAPFLIMQPAMGLGFAAAKAADPAQARLRSVMNHLAYGFGLYIFGSLANWIM